MADKLRLTTLMDESRREDCNWLASVYVVTDGTLIHDLPSDPFADLEEAKELLRQVFNEYGPGCRDFSTWDDVENFLNMKEY